MCKRVLVVLEKQTAMILEEIEILLLDIITSSERLCNDVLLCTSFYLLNQKHYGEASKLILSTYSCMSFLIYMSFPKLRE